MESLACLTPGCVALLRKHQLLRALIKAELIDSEIAGIRLEPEQEDQELNKFWKQQNIQNEEEFSAWLEHNKLLREELIKKLNAPIRLNRHCVENFSHKAEVRFLERKQQLDQVVYSLLRVKDPFKARELYLRIAEQESDFGSLAAEFSEGREKDSRGVVGPVPLMQAHPMLVDLLRSSQPGELREPIQVEGWSLIVRLESYQPATLDQAMEQRMAQELFAEWVEEEAGRMMDEYAADSSSSEGMGTIKPTL
jgi:parvulin-like peptidyl-prolyl isomerase